MDTTLRKPAGPEPAALDGAEFERQKWEDFRKPTVLLSLVCALLVLGLWSWDWVIDPTQAPATFGLRLLLSLSILVYPATLLAQARRLAPVVFYAMLLWLEVVFLWILGKLDGGAVHGVAGFMFWFILPPLLSFILPLRANVLGNLGIVLFPNVLVGGLGMLPEFELAKFNALIIPAGLTTIVGHYMIDRLLRRVYEYRAQLAWRGQAMEVMAEGVLILRAGKIAYANAAAGTLLGTEAETLVGQPLDAVASITEARESGLPKGLKTASGRQLWVRIGLAQTQWQGEPAQLLTVADLTSEHQTAVALQRSEELNRKVITHVSEALIIAQGERLIFANPAAEVLSGYSAAELLGRPFASLVHPDDLTMVLERYRRRMHGEDIDPYAQYRVLRKDGSEVWVESAAVTVYIDNAPASLAFMSNLTQRREAEEALRRSEERYRQVIDNVSEGITVVQSQRFVFCNASMVSLTGYGLDELYAMESIYELADESAWPTLKDRAERRARGEDVPLRYEFQVRCKDGSRKWVGLSVVIINWQGAPATLSFVTDTTHRHEMERALRQSQERYRSVIENMSEGLMVVQDGRIVFCNPSAAGLSGFSQDELYAWESVDRLAHPEERERMADRRRRRFAGESVDSRYEFRMLCKDGSVRFMEMSVVLIEWEGRPATLGFMFDATERHAIEEALRRSEANYRHVIESSPIGITVVRCNRMSLVNQALCRIMDADETELLAQGSILDFVHEDDQERVAAEAERQARSADPTTTPMSFRVRTVRGRLRWVEGSAVQVEWQGKPATLSFVHDVTARKQLEESLKQTLEERETILERSIVGIALLDPEGRLRWANQAMSQIFRRDLQQMRGVSLEPYYPSREAYLATGAAVSAAVKGGRPFETELRMRRQDGETFWAHLSGKAVNSRDLSQGTVWAVMDIDHRKRLEDELKRTSSERELILQSTLVGIIYSRDREHVWVNPAFAEMVGYTPEELIGQSSRLHFSSEESYREFGEQGYAVMARGAPWSTEWELVRRDGSPLWVQVLGRSLDPAAPRAGSIWTLVDITARKNAEAEVRAALEKQKELNELKSRFVSMTSHEFRTPLATILSSAELIKFYGERLPGSERSELLVNIEKAVSRMTGMLNDVLLLGRADAGRLDFKPTPVVVPSYCRTLVDEVDRAEIAEGRAGGRVRLVAPEAALTAAIDEKLMRHVLGNLLSNAHKYTPGDSPIEFRIESAETELRFVVADRGIGIPEDDLPHLFESFHRARNVGNIQGTGLGLAIVKKAIDRHGGRIEVSTRLGEGTRFTITIPRS